MALSVGSDEHRYEVIEKWENCPLLLLWRSRGGRRRLLRTPACYLNTG
jgi:hypothetical protein